MSRHVPLSRSAPRPLQINWWQAGKVARLDCTSFSCTVGETTLPYTPVIQVVNLAQGQFRIAAPAPADAAKLRRNRAYDLQLILRNALGEAIEDMRFTIEAV